MTSAHVGGGRGYDVGMPQQPPAEAEPTAPVTSQELVALLQSQHDELDRVLARVLELHGAAREDVFLQARRLLAVQETLEGTLVTTGGGGTPRTLSEEVVAAEALDHESAEFERAFARLAEAHRALSSTWAEGRPRLVGALPEADRARVATAVRMWQGEGDAYLGNSYPDMLAVAREQLERPDPAPEPD